MNDPYAQYRGTGRTTRMLKEALAAALHGPDKTVLVIGWREIDTIPLLRMMWDLREMREIVHHVNYTRREITVGGTGRILFRAGSQGRYDFNAHRYEGYDPTIPTFVDHYALEQHAEEVTRAARIASEEKRRERLRRESDQDTNGPEQCRQPTRRRQKGVRSGDRGTPPSGNTGEEILSPDFPQHLDSE